MADFSPGQPAALPGSDCGSLSAIACESWAQLEMRRVSQAVAPSEAMTAHDAHHQPSPGREAAMPVSGRHAAEVHGQSRLMHGGSGPPGAVYSAPRAAAADASASIESSLFGARSKGAVYTRANAMSAHLAHSRSQTRAGVIIERADPAAAERRLAHPRRQKADSDQADSDR